MSSSMPATAGTASSARIQSIDLLRGMVIVLMVLDHTRTFLHSSFHVFNAEDLSRTTPALFFTRWITHFCAPVFIFLTGTSACLLRQKLQSRKQVFVFLITRGLLLILLELTVFRFCWQPQEAFFRPFIAFLVIWAIGMSMLFLAFLQLLSYRVVLFLGLAILFLHNLLATVRFPEGSGMATVWAAFYSGGYVHLAGNVYAFFLFPLLPYFGLIALGYCLGYLYNPAFTALRRKKILLSLGAGAVVVFIVLRYFNTYGDPSPWEPGKNAVYSVMAFLRATKYPLSLFFALMTLGPSLLVLAFTEPVRNRVTRFFVTVGSVPLFYYILHLLLLALFGYIFGFSRHSLTAVYGFSFILVVLLYLLCKWYAVYKFAHPEKKWLKYI